MEVLAVAATLTQLIEGALVVSKSSIELYTAYRNATDDAKHVESQNATLSRILVEAKEAQCRLRRENNLGMPFTGISVFGSHSDTTRNDSI